MYVCINDHLLVLGDCLEVMPELSSADMVLADLPYGVTAAGWDRALPFKDLWAQYDALTPLVLLTATQPFASRAVVSNEAAFKYQWVWDRVGKVSGHLDAKRRPMRRHELVLVFSQGPHRYYPIMSRGEMAYAPSGTKKSILYGDQVVSDTYATDLRYPVDILAIPAEDARKRYHPTQKPVALMEYLIRTYTKPGDVVLDNTMGSGTTGVACVNTGRRFVGIEKDESYFGIALDRVQAAVRQPRLIKPS